MLWLQGGAGRACPRCATDFPDSSTLSKHVHEMSVRWTCGVCQFEARRPSTLRKHAEQKHEGRECELVKDILARWRCEDGVGRDEPRVSVVRESPPEDDTPPEEVNTHAHKTF